MRNHLWCPNNPRDKGIDDDDDDDDDESAEATVELSGQIARSCPIGFVDVLFVCPGVQKLMEVYRGNSDFADAETQEDTQQKLHNVRIYCSLKQL